MDIIVNILNDFINVLSVLVSSTNKLELYCGISAIIVAYIIFVAELVSSKDSSKIYKRIIIKKSGIITQLIIVMIIFLLLWYCNENTCVINIIVSLFIFIHTIYFTHKFILIIKILKSADFYNKIRNSYIKRNIELFNKYDKKKQKLIDKGYNKIKNGNYKNICYEKYYYDYNEDYIKITAPSSGVLRGIDKINFTKIDSIITDNTMNYAVNKDLPTSRKKGNTKKIIVCNTDNEYVKKDTVIIYLPKEYSYLEKKFNNISVVPERNNDEMITEIILEYTENFIDNSIKTTTYISEQSYFDLYELYRVFVDSGNKTIISLLDDSIRYIRQNIDRKNKNALNNIISLSKNILIYTINKNIDNISLQKNLMDDIIYDSFELLTIVENGDEAKKEVKYFMQNVVGFLRFELKTKKCEIRKYIISSLSNYIKLIVSSDLSNKYDLISIAIDNYHIDEREYDTFTTSRIRSQIIKLSKGRKKQELKKSIESLEDNICTINNLIMYLILACLYECDHVEKTIYCIKQIVKISDYGYNLHELIKAYLNPDELSEDMIHTWGVLTEPYKVVSNVNSIDKFNALIILISYAEFIEYDLPFEYYQIKDKYFIERLINELQNINNSKYKKLINNEKNSNIENSINKLKELYDYLLEEEKKKLINSKIPQSNLDNFISGILSYNKNDSKLLNYYFREKLIENSNKKNNNYNGYNTVVDKEIFVSYDNFTFKMAEDIRNGLMNYKEKILIESFSEKVIELKGEIDNNITSAIEKLKKESDDEDIIIICDWIYSKNIIRNKNNLKYKFNGYKYRVIDQVNTGGKIFVVNKNKLPKIISYKFTDEDHLKEKNMGNSDIYISIVDLSKKSSKRKKIIEEKPEWLNEEKDKETYLKTKICLKVFQKFDIKEVSENIGYYFYQ